MIQQVAFKMPTEIAAGILAGKYVQYGGVVRDGAGRIVKHLKPADVSDGANKAMQVAAQRKSAMDSFNAAFSDYLRALADGELTLEGIDALETAIAALGGDRDGSTVEIGGDQFKSLVRSVRDYTDRLSKANGGKGRSAILKLFEKRPNDVNGLRECLATQREILGQAA